VPSKLQMHSDIKKKVKFTNTYFPDTSVTATVGCLVNSFKRNLESFYFDRNNINNSCSKMWLRQTLPRLRKVQITIPQLSPTHSKAKIYKWGGVSSSDDVANAPPMQVECYSVLCVVECSPDLLSEENREPDQVPYMILESQEDGSVIIHDHVLKNKDRWYNVGEVIGEIDDGDQTDNSDEKAEWTWQAYKYSNDKDLIN